MTQDFTKTPNHSSAPPPADAPPPLNAPQPTSSVSALAIVSLVLAVMGFFCLGPLTFLPAVICGHIALSKIKRCGGALGGRGMALAGTIVGYIGLLISLLFLPLLWLSKANMETTMENAVMQLEQTQDISELRQISMACIIYVDDHDGQWPPDLATALSASEMDTALLQDDEGHLRYELVVKGSVNAVRNHSTTPMIIDLRSGATAYVDGHVETNPGDPRAPSAPTPAD